MRIVAMRRGVGNCQNLQANLECGGIAKRRHRFGSRSPRVELIQSAVAASLCRRTPN